MYLALIVTTRELLGEGLRVAVHGSDQMRLLGSVMPLETALKRPAYPAPDLVIYDAGLRPWLSLQGLQQLQRRWPAARSLVLLGDESESAQAALLKAGLPPWVPDHLPVVTLREKLLQLARGGAGSFWGGDMPITWLQWRHRQKISSLTARECHVLEMLAEGCSNKQIADRLGLREMTVKSYLKGIYGKLQVSNRVQATLVWQEASRLSGEPLPASALV